MNEQSSAFLSPPQTWHRDRYRLALVGTESARHRDLVARAGYVVVAALDGHEASGIFREGEPFDVVILDFALKGRPPEAVLLFARRTSPGAPCIALVGTDDAEGFRRAFLAGARDVLPVPARGEDLLSSIDTVLEPRALGELVEGLKEELRGHSGIRPPAASPGPRHVIVDDRAREDAAALQKQALDAFAERDRAVQAGASAKKKLTSLRRQIKERDQRLALMERACEELTGKLKALRDERRQFEARALEAERRIAQLEAALESPGSVYVESRPTDPNLHVRPAIDTATGISPPPSAAVSHHSPLPSDPDAEAQWFETDDHHRPATKEERTVSVRVVRPPKDELEKVFQSYVESERRIAELRDELAHPSVDGGGEALDAETVLSAREEDERRLQELESKLERRAVLEARVKQLEDELLHVDALKRRVAELEGQVLARDAALPSDQVSALQRIDELERLLTERDGKIAAIESARMLEKHEAKGVIESTKSALHQEREGHAEARGILDAIRMERDSLRRRVAELEREAAEALTRVEELTPLVTEIERLRSELRQATRRALSERDARR